MLDNGSSVPHSFDKPSYRLRGCFLPMSAESTFMPPHLVARERLSPRPSTRSTGRGQWGERVRSSAPSPTTVHLESWRIALRRSQMSGSTRPTRPGRCRGTTLARFRGVMSCPRHFPVSTRIFERHRSFHGLHHDLITFVPEALRPVLPQPFLRVSGGSISMEGSSAMLTPTSVSFVRSQLTPPREGG